jgi:hypothetical protein
MRLPAPGVVVVAALAALASSHPAAAGGSGGGQSCRLVHGRLAVWNGNPAVRIWPVGTQRELGVVDAHGDAAGDKLLPTEVEQLIQAAPDRTVVFGDYRVCALTRQRPGRMQIVYIDGASHLRAEAR